VSGCQQILLPSTQNQFRSDGQNYQDLIADYHVCAPAVPEQLSTARRRFETDARVRF